MFKNKTTNNIFTILDRWLLSSFSMMYKNPRKINDTNLVVSPPKKNWEKIPIFKNTIGLKSILLSKKITKNRTTHKNFMEEK